MSKVWLKGEFEFASLFSYRIPNFSPAYAPSSPLPGPSTVKLALVSTRIEATGHVDEGKALFELVKEASVGLEPPHWLAVSRTFQRRLKRIKAGSIGQSFGIREYVHHEGAIGLYIEVDQEAVSIVSDTLRRLRRIGTSDSLLYCIGVLEVMPDQTLIARQLEEFQTMLDASLFRGRPVIPLRDIKPGTKFDQVNPYKKTSGDFTISQTYIFPLRIDQTGDGWVRYERYPFEIQN